MDSVQTCLCLHEPLTSCFPFHITTRKLQAKVKTFLGRPSPAGISPICLAPVGCDNVS